jgi:spermidine synthase
MAFAAFGIITPVLSVVLSVFMAGLALGSWAAGRFVGAWVARTGRSAALLYAGAELAIGAGAFAVPACFAAGQRLLLAAGQSNSVAYLALSALVLAVSILPWCVAMGATFPLMMAYVREQAARDPSSFSYLYLANVLGAMCGTLVTAVVLVELLGFCRSLLVAAAGNAGVALAALWLGMRSRAPSPPPAAGSRPPAEGRAAPEAGVAAILFSTGFCAMALEVVWTRAFTHVLHTQVYSFAAVVFTYLAATFFGSVLYRRGLRSGRGIPLGSLLAFLAVAALLPVIVNDTRYINTFWPDWRSTGSQLVVLASICPLCAGLGYLTPRLVDSYSRGDPLLAGRAYAINVIGCILGPLVACYGLLPWLGSATSRSCSRCRSCCCR